MRFKRWQKVKYLTTQDNIPYGAVVEVIKDSSNKVRGSDQIEVLYKSRVWLVCRDELKAIKNVKRT